MNDHLDVMFSRLFWVIGAVAPIVLVAILVNVTGGSTWWFVAFVPAVGFWLYRVALWVASARKQSRLIKGVEAETNRLHPSAP
jgi:hypothetical protein